jgi:ParB family chromosome partitioning protein
MSTKRTGLGRGLDALLGDVATAKPVPPLDKQADQRADQEADRHARPPATKPADDPGDEGLRMISVDLLRRGAYQPRQDIHPESLEELADSIRAQGLIQPIVVRPLPSRDPAGARQYEIVAGERRWRAAQLAGLELIPAMVKDLTDSSAIAVALIENIQRENLGPLEEAAALRRLIDEFELTHEAAAEAVGRSRTAVSNIVRLLELGEATKALVQQGDLEMGHARALLALGNTRKQAEIAALIVKRRLSVRATESLVKKTLEGSNSKPASDTVDPNIRQLQDNLAERLGARVAIQHGAKGMGKLVIAYNSLDELEGILAHIK